MAFSSSNKMCYQTYTNQRTQTGYWRLLFELSGFHREIVLSYNRFTDHLGFLNRIQTRLNPLGAMVDAVTVPMRNNMGSYTIHNQNEFYYASDNLVNPEDLFHPNRGVPTKLVFNKENKALNINGWDSGYMTGESNAE